jgi:hypothetical protein
MIRTTTPHQGVLATNHVDRRLGREALPCPCLSIPHRIRVRSQVSGHEFTRAGKCILNLGFSPCEAFSASTLVNFSCHGVEQAFMPAVGSITVRL